MTEDAKKRKGQPVTSGVLWYFPNAIKAIAECSKAGNDQHHPDKPLHWDMSKSADEPDAMVRHLIDHRINPMDTDGILHLTKVAWRSLAMLERYLTDQEHQPSTVGRDEKLRRSIASTKEIVEKLTR